MPEFKTEPIIVPSISGLLPEGERNRRVALTSFVPLQERVKVPTREVTCYECGRVSNVPAAALSALCSHCHAHLNMADVELKAGSTRTTVRTLGDVTVQADAVLSHLLIVCRNLTVQGRATGAFRCSGTLTVQGELHQVGKFEAAELFVSRNAKVVFDNHIEVGRATINGAVSGHLKARGEVLIRRHGVLRGRCKASRLMVEPGGSYLDDHEDLREGR